MAKGFLLAIDQGTSSSRTVVYDADASPVASAQQEFTQIYPQPGWVEHDPEEIWASVKNVTRQAVQDADVTAANIAGIGITNQRETTLVWDRQTGRCIYNAIVWQDRRTAAQTDALQHDGAERLVIDKTGLRLDPYFSATKVAWILDNVDPARGPRGPDCSTTNPGRSSASLPKPYVTHDPILGRPGCGAPVFTKILAGPWLNTSVVILWIQQTSSTMWR